MSGCCGCCRRTRRIVAFAVGVATLVAVALLCWLVFHDDHDEHDVHGSSTLPLSSLSTSVTRTPLNPLGSSSDEFGASLNALLSTPTVKCERPFEVSADAARRNSSRTIDFPSLEASRWTICLDHIRQPCLVYSAKFGGSDEFEVEVASLGCDVFLFDPSLNDDEVRHHAENGIRAYSRALGGVNGIMQGMTGAKRLGNGNGDANWHYWKAGETVHELGHSTRSIDVLRLDLHGGEWDALHSFATAGTLTSVRQIVASTHVWSGESSFSLIDRFMRTQKLVAAGFAVFRSEPMVDRRLNSQMQSCCRVVGWMRTDVKNNGNPLRA